MTSQRTWWEVCWRSNNGDFEVDRVAARTRVEALSLASEIAGPDSWGFRANPQPRCQHVENEGKCWWCEPVTQEEGDQT